MITFCPYKHIKNPSKKTTHCELRESQLTGLGHRLQIEQMHQIGQQRQRLGALHAVRNYLNRLLLLEQCQRTLQQIVRLQTGQTLAGQVLQMVDECGNGQNLNDKHRKKVLAEPAGYEWSGGQGENGC